MNVHKIGIVPFVIGKVKESLISTVCVGESQTTTDN